MRAETIIAAHNDDLIHFSLILSETSLALLWFFRWIGVTARLVYPYNSDQTLCAKHTYRNKWRNGLMVDALNNEE